MKTKRAPTISKVEGKPQQAGTMSAEPKLIDLYVEAMTGASGLDRNQAKTCIYYGLATYRLEELQNFPILFIRGNRGTGKSSALRQISKTVDGCKMISGRTQATVRDQLNGASVAFIDEADTIPGLEELLTSRYSRENSDLAVKQQASNGGFFTKNMHIFGATVVVRRSPFVDVALRSRTIEINTKKRDGQYQIAEVPSLKEVADELKVEFKPTSERVMDVWEPLLAVARAMGDGEWLEYATQQIEQTRSGQALDASVEPNDAVVNALRVWCFENAKERVRLSELRTTLTEEYDLKLTVSQISAICQQLGVKVVNTHGYFWAVLDQEQLDQLAKDMGISDEEG